MRLFRFKERAENLAFNQIYDLAKSKVTFMLKNQFPMVDISDIQEYYDTAMLAVYEDLEEGQITEKRTLVGYIYTIARNKLVDDLRRNKRKKELFIDQDVSINDRWSTAALEEAEAADSALLEAVGQIVSQLDYPCDTIIPSRYYDNIKWSIVAELSGYSSDKSVFSGHKICLRKIRSVIVTKYKDLCGFLS